MWSKIQVWALRKAFMKIAPIRISMSEPGCDSNNFYSTRIKFGEVSALVREIEADTVRILKYNSETDQCDIEDDIYLRDVNIKTIEITYYLHNYVTTYIGINSFILHCLTKKDFITIKLKRCWNSILQLKFNHQELQIKPRYELLSYIIDNYGVSGKNFDLISLMSDIYTLRFFRHPDRQQCQNKVRIYVDSFVESGEVGKIENGTYKVNGKAIVTLELFQIEERRHKDSLRLQYSMILLTLLLTILASIQAGLIKLEPFLDLSK